MSLVYCGGNINIDGNLNIIYNSCKIGDRIVLFFVKIESINGVSIKDIISNYKNIFNSKGVLFRYTTYYCYEELYLSYPKLLDMINVKYKDLISKIQVELLSNRNYLDSISIDNIIELFKSDISNLTREELSSAILSMITQGISGNFNILKKYIGDCWINDCKDTSLNTNVCDRCTLDLRTFKDKLEDLDSTSVSKFSEPFSTLFY